MNDDYVKFIRFAQWKIEKTGQGILGFITNHAWLDNPTFRGMRFSLMQSFDEIYVLNLHGSALKKEKVPEEIQKKENIGEWDEGVFGIRPGTAITLAIKSGNTKGQCKVYSAEQWGLRHKKFEWLENNDIETTNWDKISPETPTYLFTKRNERGWKGYSNFVSISEIFPVNSVGIVTSRDEFVIDFDKRTLENRIRTFINSNDTDDLIRQGFGLKDSKSWNVSDARAELRKVSDWENYIKKILYRPFDERWIFYHPAVIERSRKEVMYHMLQPNLALITAKRNRLDHVDSFLVSDQLVETKCGESTIQSYTFPLYRYHKTLSPRLWDSQDKQGIIDLGDIKEVNIIPQQFADFEAQFGKRLRAEEILYYIYAILYSNIYRKRYQEFLKSDFPRIPFTNDYQIFQHLAVLGEQLVELHLLKSKILDTPLTHYEGHGDDIVEKPDYHLDDKRLYINNVQYFDKISPEIWNYFIGGYQVLDKWLKDRKGRILSLEDQLHFRKVITALTQTIDIQKRIDKFYPEVEKNTSK